MYLHQSKVIVFAFEGWTVCLLIELDLELWNENKKIVHISPTHRDQQRGRMEYHSYPFHLSCPSPLHHHKLQLFIHIL